MNEFRIIHTKKERAANFLGYPIYKMARIKASARRNILGRFSFIVLRPVLSSPISKIVKRLFEKKYVSKVDTPTQKKRFINYQLSDIINHYYSVEQAILNYYSLCTNYRELATKVHYILRYSCVLTIASKMGLKTKKKVFNKYGKNLKLLDCNNKTIAYYPTIIFVRPKKILQKFD